MRAVGPTSRPRHSGNQVFPVPPGRLRLGTRTDWEGIMGETTSTAVAEAVTLREIEPDDVKECARICFEAFGGIDDHHRFPRDFPSIEFAEGLMQAFVGSPSI